MFYMDTEKLKDGSAIINLANETTSSGYLYAVSKPVAVMISEMAENDLGDLIPCQSPGVTEASEAQDIASSICSAAIESGLEEDNVWCDFIDIDTKWFNSGWK